VTIDTHAAQKVVMVAPDGPFTVTVTGTGRGTLSTLTSGPTRFFTFDPSDGDTRTTLSLDPSGVPLGPARPDSVFTAVYTCIPGRSLIFYKTPPIGYMIDGPLVTLTSGVGTASSTASPTPS
jgi:hypothetical protein